MKQRRPRWVRLVGVMMLMILVLPPLWVELRPSAPVRAAITLPPVEGERFRVFVADWGYHTAIILEQPPGWRLGPPGEETAAFVEFAWGDRRFYMESNYWPHSVFATLLLPTSSVTYLDGRAAPPDAGFRSLHVREVTASQLRELATGLERSIAHDATGGRREAHPKVPGYAGRFLPGVGSYLWWTNCNRWTVDRLAAAGLARGGRGVILSGQVAGKLKAFRVVQPGGDGSAE